MGLCPSCVPLKLHKHKERVVDDFQSGHDLNNLSNNGRLALDAFPCFFCRRPLRQMSLSPTPPVSSLLPPTGGSINLSAESLLMNRRQRKRPIFFAAVRTYREYCRGADSAACRTCIGADERSGRGNVSRGKGDV